MAISTREQVGPILEGLRTESRKLFMGRLREIWSPTFDGANMLTSYAVDDTLRVLEENVSKLTIDAVDRALLVSKNPEVFAQINESQATYLSDLEHDMGKFIQLTNQTVNLNIFSEARLGEIRRRLERQVDGYRDAFADIEIAAPEVDGAKRGAKPKYDWNGATHAVWGQIYRGDLKPQKQADIELALVAVLTKSDNGPETTTARPYARPIWRQMRFEPED